MGVNDASECNSSNCARASLIIEATPRMCCHSLMSEDEHDQEGLAYAALVRWAEIMNKRNGYGSMFARHTPNDKSIVEQSVMDEWQEAMSEAFGIELLNAKQNPDDPPDFYAHAAGKVIGIELVELINKSHINRIMKKGESPFRDRLYHDTQWTFERFRQAISAVIDKKATSYAKRSIKVDALVIYTGEPWLTTWAVEDWLSRISFDPSPTIGSVFLLLDYRPGYAKHWPVFWVHGELAGQERPN